jgi:hypothetical protein
VVGGGLLFLKRADLEALVRIAKQLFAVFTESSITTMLGGAVDLHHGCYGLFFALYACSGHVRSVTGIDKF